MIYEMIYSQILNYLRTIHIFFHLYVTKISLVNNNPAQESSLQKHLRMILHSKVNFEENLETISS